MDRLDRELLVARGDELGLIGLALGVVGLDQLPDALDLLARQREIAIAELEPVVLGRIVASGDHDPAVGGEAMAGVIENGGRHEAYVEAFGLDQGAAEATAAGWRVRFDRQLMQRPVDLVWAALTRDDAIESIREAIAGARLPPARR